MSFVGPLCRQKRCPHRRKRERGSRIPVTRARLADYFADRLADAAKHPRLPAPSTEVQIGKADTGEEDPLLAADPRHSRDQPAQFDRKIGSGRPCPAAGQRRFVSAFIDIDTNRIAGQITIRWMRTNCAMVTPDTPCSGAAGRDNASAMRVLPKTRNSFSESQYSGTTPQRSPISLLYET